MLIDKLKKCFESILFLLGFSLFIVQGIVSAQNFTLEKSVIDQGGGASQSTNYHVVNAVGQASPVTVILSANHTVSAGFLAGEELITKIKESQAEPKLIPTEFKLYQNYPNPFNPETFIQYQLPAATHVEISIFNLAGKKVATVVNDHQTAGDYKVIWNGTDETSQPVSSGLYLYQLQAGKFMQVRKMLLLR